MIRGAGLSGASDRFGDKASSPTVTWCDIPRDRDAQYFAKAKGYRRENGMIGYLSGGTFICKMVCIVLARL